MSSVELILLTCLSWFPHQLENLENGRTFSSQGKVGNLNTLEKSGNFSKILEKLGDFRQV